MAKPGSKIVPAHVSFFAIFSPALSNSEETFEDQIVFYYSKDAHKRRRRANDALSAEEERGLREQENEKLRQIGLAQGLVGFAKSFSGGENVDSVETEKSRIVMSELEDRWWVLASIDLTQLPKIDASNASHPHTDGKEAEQQWEYSSREVSPPALLLRQIQRAYRIFLIHHGPSIHDLFVRLTRDKFCAALDRFWTRFIHDWDVLFHGSPAVDVFGAMKLAAGGELGIGVGEEEWGSGEREVLEGFAGRTDGLIDLVVSRFGEHSQEQEEKRSLPRPPTTKQASNGPLQPWMGTGNLPKASDGVLFSGIGALTRQSLRDIADWMECIYTSGDRAYGVKDNPSSDRRKRRRGLAAASRSVSGQTPAPARQDSLGAESPSAGISPPGVSPKPQEATKGIPGIPPPIVSAVEASLERAAESAAASETRRKQEPAAKQAFTDPDVWMKVLTLGYSSGAWSKRPAHAKRSTSHTSVLSRRSHSPADSDMQHMDPEPELNREALMEERMKGQVARENQGHFIIGLQGELNSDDTDDTGEPSPEDDEDAGQRILLRTLQVEVLKPLSEEVSSESGEPRLSIRRFQRVRVVVYVHRPFIYTFLFEPRTGSLGMTSFYRNLHTYLAPLHRPLSASTSPARVADRIASASHLFTTSISPSVSNETPIWDLVFDPKSLTIHSSIPDIPQPGDLLAEVLGTGQPATSASTSHHTPSKNSPWTRLEALSVHMQILSTVVATRKSPAELERPAKTSRAFWVVWLRLPASSPPPPPNPLRAPPPAINPVQNAANPQIPSSPSTHGPASRSPIPSLKITEPTDTTLVDDSSKADEDERDNAESSGSGLAELREAFLVRRARDAGASRGRGASGKDGSSGWSFGFAGSGAQKDPTGGSAAGWGPARLAEGIGIDARKYVEGLLSLNR